MSAPLLGPGGFRRVVDLSHTLSPDFPTFDGACHFALDPWGPRDARGFYGNGWSIDEHVGTHLDAPFHMEGGHLTTDAIAPADLVVPAVVIDVRAAAAADPDARLGLDDLRAFEARHGTIPRGAAVLMWSGWDERIIDAARYRNPDEAGVMHFPGFDAATATFLREERDARGIGVDTLSLDCGASRDFAVHRAWLPHDRWGLENLTRLGELPPVGAWIFVGTPKVKGASGGATRVLAVVP